MPREPRRERPRPQASEQLGPSVTGAEPEHTAAVHQVAEHETPRVAGSFREFIDSLRPLEDDAGASASR